MSQTTEELFLEYIAKNAEDTYPDQTGNPPRNTEPVVFSNVAQETSKDVRSGVPDRIFSDKGKSDAAERALVGNILPRGETSSIQLAPVEKVSFPRAQTLMEQAVGKLGFL